MMSKHWRHNIVMNRLKYHKWLYAKSCGFTLIELIAALSIIAVIASLSIPRFMDLGTNASSTTFRSAISELNNREFLQWTNTKMSNTGWLSDDALFPLIDFDLGDDYQWNPKAKKEGGKLNFKNLTFELERIPSTATHAGKWKILETTSE